MTGQATRERAMNDLVEITTWKARVRHWAQRDAFRLRMPGERWALCSTLGNPVSGRDQGRLDQDRCSQGLAGVVIRGLRPCSGCVRLLGPMTPPDPCSPVLGSPGGRDDTEEHDETRTR